MCFSATASFSVAAATAAVGIATVRHARRRRELPLALIPLLFAAQQAVEGVVWLQLDGANDPPTLAALSFIFLLFAKVLWPAYIAPVVLLVEPDRRRRYALAVLALVGAGVAIDLLIGLIGQPATATIRGHSIAYSDLSAPASGFPWDAIPYLLCTGLPLFLSSHRAIRTFGVAVMLGFAIAALIYLTALVSVWCFFAAAVSTLLYFYFRRAAFGVPAHHAR